MTSAINCHISCVDGRIQLIEFLVSDYLLTWSSSEVFDTSKLALSVILIFLMLFLKSVSNFLKLTSLSIISTHNTRSMENELELLLH